MLIYSGDQESKTPNKQRHFPLWKNIKSFVDLTTVGPQMFPTCKRILNSKTIISDNLNNKDKVIAEFKAGCNAEINSKQKHNFDYVNELLIKSFRCAKDKKIPLSREMFLKAQQFTCACGYSNSEKQDINWVNRWKVREEVNCKKLHREAKSVN